MAFASFRLEAVNLVALLCCLSLIVFWQTSLPLLFVIFPCLLLLEVRLGLAGSAVGLLAISVIGGYFTARGHGPIGLTHLIHALSAHPAPAVFYWGQHARPLHHGGGHFGEKPF